MCGLVWSWILRLGLAFAIVASVSQVGWSFPPWPVFLLRNYLQIVSVLRFLLCSRFWRWSACSGGVPFILCSCQHCLSIPSVVLLMTMHVESGHHPCLPMCWRCPLAEGCLSSWALVHISWLSPAGSLFVLQAQNCGLHAVMVLLMEVVFLVECFHCVLASFMWLFGSLVFTLVQKLISTYKSITIWCVVCTGEEMEMDKSQG